MKNKNIKLLIWALTVSLILIAIPTAIKLGPKTIGKKFADSPEFQQEMTHFYKALSTTVLNPLQLEEAKERLTVTAGEIEEHRTRYGELSDQIQSIQWQYADQIQEAEEVGDDRVKESLIKTRDQKIADIELNFENDDHVREKILTEKVEALKILIANQQSSWSSFPVAYELTDVETGEVFKRGDIGVSAFYKKSFSKESPFKAHSVVEDESIWEEASHQVELTDWAIGGWTEKDEVIAYTNYDSDYGYEVQIADVKNPVREFTGSIVVSEKALKESYLSNSLQHYNYKNYRNFGLWIIALVGLLLLFTKLKFKKEWVTKNRLLTRYEKLRIDLKVLLFIATLFFIVEMFIPNATARFFYDDVYRGAWSGQLFGFIPLTLGVMFLTVQLVDFIERWKVVGQFDQDIRDSYTARLLQAFCDLFLNRTLGIQLFILLNGFFLAGIGFMVVVVQPFAILLYIPLVIFLGLPALYLFARRGAYLSRIFVATEKMANGTLYEEIPVKGKSPIAKHANHLNKLREGVRVSMSEQAKSERLKTELITNVSHDLRTPLTSIITYTDLLKAKDLSEEERLKYVDILDKKSARLKTLIEDLFEVSKMASGNLELNKHQVDLTQLLQQALAEHEEEISGSSLDFRVQLPESALIAHVDGQRWWRVLDNLIINALKYSMSGTRVYITLEKLEDRAVFVVKNISKHELNENSDELFERFKRGDDSRHTDGSGLGLAIAQSIIDMHNGKMTIDVDGDLFKVTVEIPV